MEEAQAEGGTPILAYALSGPVTAKDAERLEADFARHERFRLLVRFEQFEGVRPSALSGSFMRMKRDGLRRVERYAIVGGPGWVAGLHEGSRPAPSDGRPPFRDR